MVASQLHPAKIWRDRRQKKIDMESPSAKEAMASPSAKYVTDINAQPRREGSAGQ
jgi:hypothetical protein